MSTSDGTVLGTTTIVDHGPNTQRWNLVILGDGYRAAEMGTFAADAQAFVDRFFSVKPFDELQGVINVHRIDVASIDSGADDPTACGGTGAKPRTYFDAAFCNNGIRRLLTVSKGTVFAVAGAQLPQWHVALVLVNSPIFGGAGGSVAVASRAAGATDIALHEMGHTAFGLADEYEYYAGCGVDTDHNQHPDDEPAEPNVTRQRSRSFLKWRAFVDSATPVPTKTNPDCTQCDTTASPVPPGTVGSFEGAHYYHCGAFRPEFDCRMRNIGSEFCAVCRQVIRTRLARFVLPGSVSGTPGIAHRSDVGFGTLEIVTPMSNIGFGHYWRNSNAPGMPWNGPFVFGTNVGHFDDIALNTMGSTMEVVGRFGGSLIHYWRDDAPTFQWHGPTLIPLGGVHLASGAPCLINAGFNFAALLSNELIVPLASGGIAHLWRDVRSPTITWHGPTVFAQNLGRVDAVTMIQSTFGDPSNGNMPTNLEVVARVGTQLVHFWRDAGPAFHWHGPIPFGQPNASGNPSLIVGPFGIWKRNFELVVPLATGGIGHYWRDNNTAGLPWHGPTVFGTDIGRFDALDMVVDNYTLWEMPPHTLQVVARFQNKLLYYYRDAGPALRWTLL